MAKPWSKGSSLVARLLSRGRVQMLAIHLLTTYENAATLSQKSERTPCFPIKVVDNDSLSEIRVITCGTASTEFEVPGVRLAREMFTECADGLCSRAERRRVRSARRCDERTLRRNSGWFRVWRLGDGLSPRRGKHACVFA